jgi:uncharacterized protein (DUF2147 family)
MEGKLQNMRFLLTFFVLFWFSIAFSQSPVGRWKTIDDNSGEERSIVEIYEKDGKIYGKIIKLFRKPGEDPDPICDECNEDDSRYNKKIIGMEIITGLKKSGDAYEHGEILDPESGRVYKCRVWLEGSDLKVRGYWGPFYRTQTWKKG